VRVYCFISRCYQRYRNFCHSHKSAKVAPEPASNSKPKPLSIIQSNSALETLGRIARVPVPGSRPQKLEGSSIIPVFRESQGRSSGSPRHNRSETGVQKVVPGNPVGVRLQVKPPAPVPSKETLEINNQIKILFTIREATVDKFLKEERLCLEGVSEWCSELFDDLFSEIPTSVSRGSSRKSSKGSTSVSRKSSKESTSVSRGSSKEPNSLSRRSSNGSLDEISTSASRGSSRKSSAGSSQVRSLLLDSSEKLSDLERPSKKKISGGSNQSGKAFPNRRLGPPISEVIEPPPLLHEFPRELPGEVPVIESELLSSNGPSELRLTIGAKIKLIKKEFSRIVHEKTEEMKRMETQQEIEQTKYILEALEGKQKLLDKIFTKLGGVWRIKRV
jgi:hypothetical protein